MDQLKTKTKADHQSLDSYLIPQIKNIDAQGYIALLKTFYGYFHPVEHLIGKYINDSLLPDYSERRKAQYILDDLHALGANIAPNEVCTRLPNIHNIPTALGAMYVLEGSTLGGAIISKMLLQRLGENYEGALKFYNGYGPGTQTKWQAFSSFANGYTNDAAVEDEMITAAKETFVMFKDWIVVCDGMGK